MLELQTKESLIHYMNYFQLNYNYFQVSRKVDFCREFLEVFGRVDPGKATDWWAVTQLELIESRSVLLQRDLESGKIPASVFKTSLIKECQSNISFSFLSLFFIQELLSPFSGNIGQVIKVLEFEQPGKNDTDDQAMNSES